MLAAAAASGMTSQVRPYRYCLDAKAIGWIEDVVPNAESRMITELVEFFPKHGLSRLQAESVLRDRGDLFLNVFRIS
jgi:hypothetical protein